MNKIIILLLIVFIQGCSNTLFFAKTTEINDFTKNKPPQLRPYFKALYEEGERNAVLNSERLGLAAMEANEFKIAEVAFDQAISRISTIYADNEQAEKSRSLWHAENVKDFKGESYERSMAFYYRGLLYFKSGELDNARASFLAANLQDKYAENEKYASDFGLMDYLAGWSAMCMGDMSSSTDLLNQSIKETNQLSKAIPYQNNLLIVESGLGPHKVTTGTYNEILSFSDDSADPSVIIDINNKPSTPILGGDILFQAVTRGGRQIDIINNGKAEFKSTVTTIGSTALVVGSTLSVMSLTNMGSSASQVMGAAGAGFMLAGVIAHEVGSAINAEADARQWSSLPKNIFILPLNQSIESPDIKYSLKSIASPFFISPNLKISHGECNLYWGRIRTDNDYLATMFARDIRPDFYDEDQEKRNSTFRLNLKNIYN